ncbi:PIN domain-like protein [Trametes gibbosa]|nr:PIN domain-like protein [Trametes gibbosa]
MGVLGFTPFLQKACPEVLKILPNRFNALSGKKVVIDGTLITQRFHFAPLPHPFRHVLGWYRLIKHLQASDVQAICVFDGKARHVAKEREVARRRNDRTLTLSRGVYETSRLSRLRKLIRVLQTSQSLESKISLAQQLMVLRDIAQGMPITSAVVLPSLSGVGKRGEIADVLSLQKSLRLNSGDAPRSHSQHEVAMQSSYQTTGDLQEVLSVDDAPVDIVKLYKEFQQSAPDLVSFAGISATNFSSVLEAPPKEAEGEHVECVISKSQHSLTLEEGELWKQLAGCKDFEALDNTLTSTVEELEAKSGLLSESYARRTHPPTSETYEQSKEILHAMGVPCVQPSGAFEAEALAASLVINGYADYVASEDTDVLVYEAPLIRNITSSTGPLVLISGADVRTVLQLDRAGYVDFALLLGTDFSQRIKNVGPARALRFIREHGSIERVLEHERQYPPRISESEYLQQVQLARRVFQTLPPTPDTALLQQGEVDVDAVWAILEKYHLHRYVAEDWDYGHALTGNYFSDDPVAA